MTRLVTFVWPLRWPGALLLLAGNMTRLVPADTRDAYQLVSVGAVLLFAVRILLIDHEAREDRKAKAREDRMLLADQGVEALRKRLEAADAAITAEVGALAARLDRVDGPDGLLPAFDRRLHVVEEFVDRFGAIGK